ncbi:MAG: polysaccharide deacetylase family protein [Oscillospiraceae bacterium]|nr:polysaccharide deacetylase family protein [Oscillospiraceae bacterium]
MQFCFPNGLTKALTLSYDDGRSTDRELVDFFNALGLKATFHLNSGCLGREEYVYTDEAPFLYAGHEIACHTVSHPHLTRLPESEMLWEIFGDKGQLERLIGQPVRGFSYPYGEVSEGAAQAVRLSGLEYARTVNGTGRFSWPEDFLRWDPTCHHSQLTDELVERFLSLPDHEMCPILFVWGHSADFDRDGNREEVLARYAQLAGQPDIWYATNIQLKDYLQAIRSLAVTADGSLAYNPSATTVWVMSGGEPTALEPGSFTRI